MVGSGSIGIAVPEMTIRLVDDDGADVPPGATGEFLLSGPGLMRGYLNRPEATAEVLSGGWFHTGDLGRQDERGLYYFVGRKKDIIRRSGENLAAAEVEEVLRAHPKVLEVAVIGVPDDLRGEEVKAFILPVEGQSADDDPARGAGRLVRGPAGQVQGAALHRVPDHRLPADPLAPGAEDAAARACPCVTTKARSGTARTRARCPPPNPRPEGEPHG